MKKILIISISMVLISTSYSQTKSYKRGVGYGYHSASDMQNFSKHLSWWYNWAAEPDAAIRTTYQNYNVDFTPMAWNASGVGNVGTWVNQDNNVKYILGFNEPNFTDQANMTPSAAAAAWPGLQTIAGNNQVKLVGPAVNYCGSCVSEGGTTYNNPFTYLDDFFSACTDCQVDYIAIHWYGGGNSIVSYVNDARKYNKPIWVTEFAAWDNSVTSIDDQKKYLAGTVNFLERDPDVYRYAWFIGRRQSGQTTYPYIDLYSSSGQLTELGQLYMDIPVYDPNDRYELPARIQTEEYYLMSGLFAEPTFDTDGFLNIGWTDNNDWAEYKISVPASATYNIYARVAGTKTGVIDLLVDNQLAVSVNTPNTGGWQTWSTVSASAFLQQGSHTLKMLVKEAGFNINWLEISTGAVGVEPIKLGEVGIYPNPVCDGILQLTMSNVDIGKKYQFTLLDASGKQVYQKKIQMEGTAIQLNINKENKMVPGLYILKIEGPRNNMSKKILIE